MVSGRWSADASQDVPERLTFQVPEFASTPDRPDGFSWVPDGPSHPLAAFGQVVDVDIDVWSSVSAGDELAPPSSTTRLGRFVVQEWRHDDLAGVVDVECVGLLQRVKDARFRLPVTPKAGGTFASELRRLTPGGLPVLVDAGLADRAIPKSFAWQEDRLGALYEIADAWPARLRVDQFGQLRVLPPLGGDPVAVVEFLDGERGTVVSAPRAGSRDGVANVVVARSSQTDSPARAPLQAVAEVTSGPLAPASYGEVTFFWSSPLAATQSQLKASADSILARKTRPAVVRRITAVPDPRLELDDAVAVEVGRFTRTRVLAANAGPPVDGGVASTTSWPDTTDGGAAGTLSWPSTVDGGLAGSEYRSAEQTVTETVPGDRSVGFVVAASLPLTSTDGAMTVDVSVEG